eukprot:TRINITY_DN2178_c0_g1_i6.p1 TRINITY_DN2178_c0_g1~~TRINITY_DN2178_c0_g1_i6.p1  ORF type:complete len:567 (+),score=199.69 TRINITY_DN2178_c0_g1_i6:159-1859(+)
MFNQSKELTAIFSAGFHEIEPVQRYGFAFRSVRDEGPSHTTLDREQQIISTELRKREEKERKYKATLEAMLAKPESSNPTEQKQEVAKAQEAPSNNKPEEASVQARPKSHRVSKRKKGSVMDRELEVKLKEEMERAKKLKTMNKESYNEYVKEKREKEIAKKQQFKKAMEERLKNDEEERVKLSEEKKSSEERKKQFIDALKLQIQEDNEKKQKEETEMRRSLNPSASVIGEVDHGLEIAQKEKRDAQQCKVENLLLMKKKKKERAKEKSQEKAKDEEYIKHEEALEEERRKTESRKREQHRRNMIESSHSERKHKKQHHGEDELEREYYESLNQETINKLRQEKAKQREVMRKYGNLLSEQIKETEEHKKKQRELEINTDKKLEGIPLECYKSARYRDERKRKYFQELKKQYEDTVARKSQKEVAEPCNMIIEQVTPEQEAEELKKKKAIQKSDYLNSVKELNEKQMLKKAKKVEEVKERLNNLEKSKVDAKANRVRQKEAQKRLAGELEKQSVIDVIKKKLDHADRYEWDDDVNAKYAETIESKINALKREIRASNAKQHFKPS